MAEIVKDWAGTYYLVGGVPPSSFISEIGVGSGEG